MEGDLESGSRSACIVTRGLRYRLIVRLPGDLMFITAGKGTVNRPAW